MWLVVDEVISICGLAAIRFIKRLDAGDSREATP